MFYVLPVIIAITAVIFSQISPVFDPLVISIIIGMIVSAVSENKAALEVGAQRTVAVCLPVGIALYGTQLKLAGHLDAAVIGCVTACFLVLFLSAVLFSRAFRVNAKTGMLLASGLSVCGASAIAVVSPAIEAERSHTSISIISVMTVGLVGLISYPLIKDLLGLSPLESAFLAGVSLPMLGQVKVSVAELGRDAATTAVQIKLIRIAFLVVLVTLAVLMTKAKQRSMNVPWFMVAFACLAFTVNIAHIDPALLRASSLVSSFCLSATLAGIGLLTDFEAVTVEGLRPVYAAFAAWTASLALIITGIFSIRMILL